MIDAIRQLFQSVSIAPETGGVFFIIVIAMMLGIGFSRKSPQGILLWAFVALLIIFPVMIYIEGSLIGMVAILIFAVIFGLVMFRTNIFKKGIGDSNE